MIDYFKVENTLSELREKIYKKIKRLEDDVEETKNYLKKEFERRLQEKEIEGEVCPGGSTEKGTWIPDRIEFDIFIRLKKREDFEKFYSICPEGEVMMGSRDYFRFKYRRYWVEVVPIKYIENPENADNITDLSPFHVDFVKSRTNEEMRMDIRLLKIFMKRKGVYGAETYIGGFSGYMAELLVIAYGSLINLMRKVEREWRSKVYIDIMNYYENLRDAAINLGPDKVKSPIVLIDPTFRYRNAAAALTKKSYSRFVFEIRKFLRNPTEEQFLKEVILNMKELRRRSKARGSRIFFVEIEKRGKEDYFFGKLKRIVSKVSELLEKEGWMLYDGGFFEESGRTFLYFEFMTTSMSKKKRWMGPPVWVKGPHFDNFLKKHKDIFVFEDFLAADVDNKGPKEALLEFLSLYDIKIKRCFS